MSNAMLLYAHLTDKELADKVLAAQRHCYEVLVRRHSQALYRVARMYSFAHNEAEELLADSLLRAFDSLSRYQSPLSFRTWLTKLMIDGCMGRKRELIQVSDDRQEPACVPARSAHHYDSGRYTASQETVGRVESCIEQLPIPLRSAYILGEIDGYSIAEMAHLLSTTEENVKFRLSRAKSSMRQSLRRWYRFTDIYQLDNTCCERLVHLVMSRVDQTVALPAGAPSF